MALFLKIKNADFSYPSWFSDGVRYVQKSKWHKLISGIMHIDWFLLSCFLLICFFFLSVANLNVTFFLLYYYFYWFIPYLILSFIHLFVLMVCFYFEENFWAKWWSLILIEDLLSARYVRFTSQYSYCWFQDIYFYIINLLRISIIKIIWKKWK